MRNLKRILKLVVALSVFALACGAQSKPVQSSTPLNEERLSVYREFLDKFGALHIKNLSRITLPLDFNGFPEGRPCLTGIELEDPVDALKTAHAFGTEITKGRELNLLSKRDFSNSERW
jgi:hypothetical protein